MGEENGSERRVRQNIRRKCFRVSDMVQDSQEHDRFPSLLMIAVRLQGNQRAQLQMMLTGMWELRIGVSCWHPGVTIVAVLWVNTKEKRKKKKEKTVQFHTVTPQPR